MSKTASKEDLREMAFIIIDGKNRDIQILEKKVINLKNALNKANEINIKLDQELKEYKTKTIEDLESIINELEEVFLAI